jgi:DNA-binding CsgD family transcriptional regulator
MAIGSAEGQEGRRDESSAFSDPQRSRSSLNTSNLFTPRQTQILSLLAEGMAGKQIAMALGLSHRTVESHLDRLYKTHHFANRAAALTAWLTGERPKRPVTQCANCSRAFSNREPAGWSPGIEPEAIYSQP